MDDFGSSLNATLNVAKLNASTIKQILQILHYTKLLFMFILKCFKGTWWHINTVSKTNKRTRYSSRNFIFDKCDHKYVNGLLQCIKYVIQYVL